jgi:hypothetical protein
VSLERWMLVVATLTSACSTAYKTWIDDVAVSNSARVGCPPAR